jgi:sec-independent protein translocase protein TatC
MTLVEHLYELRNRLFKACLAILVVAVTAAFFYDEIFAVLTEPFFSQVRRLAEERDIEAELTINDVAGPLILRIKIALVSGLVLASPIWLWQIWAFILPGLHRRERRWSTLFALIAGPLFMGGALLGYYVLPKGIGVLLDFTPIEVANLVEVDRYLNFILRMLLAFGVSFEIPLFIVLLNLAGVVSGRALAANRAWIVVGVFVFAAIATPSTDPVSMLFLAVPVSGLFLVSELVARLVDRRRARAGNNFDSYDPDEPSPLQLRDGPDEYDRPSQLDEPPEDSWDDDERA